MNVLLVTFGLEGMTEAEYYRTADQEAPAFAEIPGLIAKVWLADPARNTYGGVYTFVSRKALDDYLSSGLFKGLGEIPAFTNVTVQSFETLDGPTRVTHGAATAAA